MNHSPLTRNIRIRLTEEEDLAIVSLARSSGEANRSRMLRKMIREAIRLGPDLMKDDLTGFREAVRELAAVGRNINQIAHALNAGKTPERMLDSSLLLDLEDRLARLKKELADIVLRTRNRWVNLV